MKNCNIIPSLLLSLALLGVAYIYCISHRYTVLSPKDISGNVIIFDKCNKTLQGFNPTTGAKVFEQSIDK